MSATRKTNEYDSFDIYACFVRRCQARQLEINYRSRPRAPMHKRLLLGRICMHLQVRASLHTHIRTRLHVRASMLTHIHTHLHTRLPVAHTSTRTSTLASTRTCAYVQSIDPRVCHPRVTPTHPTTRPLLSNL